MPDIKRNENWKPNLLTTQSCLLNLNANTQTQTPIQHSQLINEFQPQTKLLKVKLFAMRFENVVLEHKSYGYWNLKSEQKILFRHKIEDKLAVE